MLRLSTNGLILMDGKLAGNYDALRLRAVRRSRSPAHVFRYAVTGGDKVVYFSNLKLVAAADLFTPTPDPDFSVGGSLVGWGRVLGQILKLDFDVVVPGTGPMLARVDLEAFKTRIDTLVSRATGLAKKGVRKDQLTAQLKTDDLGWQFGLTGDQPDRFYADLSQTK